MKKIFMLLVACVAMVFLSCSKDDDGDNVTPFGGKQISKLTEYDENRKVGWYATYEYDEQGRITMVKWMNDNLENGRVESYTYGDKEIQVTSGELGDDDIYTTVYTLNDKGIIASSREDCGDINIYTYNDKDQLIGVSGSENGLYIWQNDNITKSIENYGTSTYTYTKNENKNTGLDSHLYCENIDDILFDYGYFGTKNKNLIVSRSYDKQEYEYEFDKDGYITKIKWYSIVNGTKKHDMTTTIEYK